MAETRHLPKRTVGLDINDSHVVATQLRFARNGDMRLEAAGWLPRPENADDHQLAATVRQVFKQAGITASHVCASLQSPSLVLRPFRHIRLSPSELTSALTIEAEEALQKTQTEIYMDWHVNNGAQHEKDVQEGVLAAAPRREIERYLAALALADVFPVIMDAACMAVCNLYLELRDRPSAEHALCIVAFANQRADIAVLWNDSTIFPRTIYAPSGNWDQEATYLAESISDTIKYHQFKLHRPPVERMILTGVIPRRDILISRLRAIVPLVSNWNPLADIKFAKTRLKSLLNSEFGPLFTTSLGLALRRF